MAPVAATPDAAGFLGHLPELIAAGELIARTGITFGNLADVQPGHAITLFAPLQRAGAFGVEHLRGYLFAVLDLASLLHALPSAAPALERSSLIVNDEASVIGTDPPGFAGIAAAGALRASAALEFPGFRLDLEFVGDPKIFRPPLWTDARALVTLASGLVVTLLLAAYVRAIMIRNWALQEASRAAARASTMKSEFLATMSHEIRTPMNAVLGMTELLIDSKLDARQMGYARSAFTSAEQLLRIIDDILDFSKIESGRLEIDPVAIDLVELIGELGEEFAGQAREKAVELVTRYVPGTERCVLADAVRVRQVITNLVANAIKFTEHGHIVLTVEQLHDAPVGQDRVTLRISIEDTGIGIPTTGQARLFQRFEQVDGSITQRYGGTGLGLAICRQLVELMGGEIGVESTPGRGSTFWFRLTLPRHQAASVAPPLFPSLKDVKVLVVDQLPVNRTLVAEQLVRHGMRCAVAPGGEDALRQLHEAARVADPFQIVLIDYSMPGRNDARLARSIKAEPALRNAALIMFTAAGGGDLREVCAERGFSGHVTKPIRVAQLIEVLAAVCRNVRDGVPAALVPSQERAAAVHSPPTAWRFAGAQVLLAEDNRVHQAFAVAVLERLGCLVTVAGNGQEAVEATRRERFDIIFMDCQMPVVDGLEATRQIRDLMARGDTPPAPIIALTANAMRGDRERCLDAGMSAYLSKPVRGSDLEETLRRSLQPGSADEQIAAPAPAPAAVPGTSPGHDRQDRPSATSADVGGPQAKAPDDPPAKADRVAAPMPPLPERRETGAEPVLDLGGVTKARAAMGDRFPSMIEYFMEDVAAHLATIGEGLEVGDLGRVVRPAHNIKSAASQMGAMRLARLAGELETAARTALDQGTTRVDPARRTALLGRLRATFDQTGAVLKALDGLPPANAASPGSGLGAGFRYLKM